MNPNKSAQGLPLNAIIIAAIALIVLIVVWSIFSGKMSGFTKEIRTCKGVCLTKTECESVGAVASEGHEDCNQASEEVEGGVKINLGDTKVCCIKLQ